MSEETGKVKRTFRIPKEIDEALEIYAATKGMSKEEVVTTALESFLRGEIVDWSQIRGDHIIAALKLLQYIRELDLKHETEKTKVYLRARFEEMGYLSELIKKYEEKKKKEREEEGGEEEEKEGRLETLLYYLLLGLGQRLGLIEIVELPESESQ